MDLRVNSENLTELEKQALLEKHKEIEQEFYKAASVNRIKIVLKEAGFSEPARNRFKTDETRVAYMVDIIDYQTIAIFSVGAASNPVFFSVPEKERDLLIILNNLQ